MTTDVKPTATAAPAAPRTKYLTKSSLMLKLISRTKGATLAEIAEPTGWQLHSARAHLSNLRKKGRSVVRERRKNGETAYRVIDATSQAASAAVASVADPDAATNPAAA